MSLDDSQVARYRGSGHLTVPGLFEPARMDGLVADCMAWGEAVLAGLGEAERRWYVDGGTAGMLRKLDQPVFERPAFRALATEPALLAAVARLIGPAAGVAFSQIFFKPPGGGGPKPMHQDNFYFGPNDPDGMVTAWVAMDDATEANGCLLFVDGSNRGPVLDHVAPPDQPFNLQVPDDRIGGAATPAPVPKGGVSFHHGTVLHGSAHNRSADWRRAVAIHYYARGADLVRPALPYDKAKYLRLDGVAA